MSNKFFIFAILVIVGIVDVSGCTSYNSSESSSSTNLRANAAPR